MYPTGAIACDINLPELTTDLEGSHRPGHFNGVCRIVAKLLNLFKPDVACFGQKDLQQLRVIEAMVDDLMMPTRIVPMPTVREADGLAMSSRNQRLSDEDRKHAVGMYKALCEAKMLVESDGAPAPEEVEAAMKQVLQAHHIETEYVAIRHPHTLRKLDCIEPAFTAGVAALVAGQVGGVRLIDNMLLGLPRGPVEMPAAT